MVTVRKADGTVVKMTLSELNELKKKVTEPAPKPALPLSSDGRAADVEKIMKQVGELVGRDHQNRLRSIIQLYLKDVRGRAETENALLRPTQEGGLGLTSPQKDQVFKEIDQQTNSTPPIHEVDFKITHKNISVPDLEIAETLPTPQPKKFTNEPMVQKTAFPTTTTPFNAFKHTSSKKPVTPSPVPPLAPAPQAAAAPAIKKPTSNEFAALLSKAAAQPLEIKDLVSPKKNLEQKSGDAGPAALAPRPMKPAEPLSLSSTPPVKPLVRDVASVALEVGPVDELARFTLTDFRRLSPKPVEAAALLEDKFKHLKEESIMWYLEAREAWQKSPLYLMYMGALTEALSQHRPIGAVLTDTKRIQPAEIAALIAMEKKLL